MLYAWEYGGIKSFAFELADSLKTQTFDDVVQFIGADESGSFGIMHDHAPLVAALRYGLARFQNEQGVWQYIAMPGGVLRFSENKLTITSVHCFLGDDRDTIVEQLDNAMQEEDSDTHNARLTLANIEQSLMRRLVQLGKKAENVSAP